MRTEAELEAINSEHKIAAVEIESPPAWITLFRGELRVNDDDQWYIAAGGDLVVEVYDCADTSIYFTVTADEARQITETFRDA